MKSTDERIATAAVDIAQAAAALQATLDAGLAQYHNAVKLQGARVVGVGAGGGRLMAWGAAGRLLGWSLRCVLLAPATVVLRDSRSAGSGDILAEIGLSAAGETSTQWFGPSGVSFTEGVYVDVVAGSVEGALYIGTVDA